MLSANRDIMDLIFNPIMPAKFLANVVPILPEAYATECVCL